MENSLDWQYCCGIGCTTVVLPCLLELHNLCIIDLLSHILSSSDCFLGYKIV
uniref:Uncharacterized protein n=1 Tax=Arundo donax TaxID=35708 RepID=A0A0A9G2I7_ARUDO